MGIRMLHHRTTPARASTNTPARTPLPPAPATAPEASTGRIPTTVRATLRRTASDLRRAVARRQPPWRQWADLARGYLALTLTLIPRPHPPTRTFTVFDATDTLSARPAGHPPPAPGPAPDATP